MVLSIPVSAVMYGGINARGFTSEEYLSITSPFLTRAIHISVMQFPLIPPPVVSISVMAKILSCIVKSPIKTTNVSFLNGKNPISSGKFPNESHLIFRLCYLFQILYSPPLFHQYLYHHQQVRSFLFVAPDTRVPVFLAACQDHVVFAPVLCFYQVS